MTETKEPTRGWMIVEFNMGLIDSAVFAGFDYKKASILMKRKFGNRGRYNPDLDEITIDEEVHYFSLQSIEIPDTVALMVNIDQNEFKLFSNIPGLQGKLYYIDSEYSKSVSLKIRKLKEEDMKEFEDIIRMEKGEKEDE